MDESVAEMVENGQGPAVHTPDNKTQLVRYVTECFEESRRRKDRDAKTKEWEDWEKGYWGQNYWSDTLPSFKAPVVVNTGQTRMLQEISDLTEQPLKVYVTKSAATAERDQMVEKALQAHWKNEFCDHQVMLAAYHATVLPCGFLGCFWDRTGAGGQGRVDWRAIHPGMVFPDPDAENDDEWTYLNLHRVLDLVKIRQFWPEAGKEVLPDDQVSIKASGSLIRRISTVISGTLASYTGPLYEHGGAGQPAGYLKARAGIISHFVYDPETEEKIEEIINPTTGEPSLHADIRKKYPNGRMIQTANNALLFDGPYPYWGRFPLVRVSLQLCDTFWPPTSIYANVIELYKAGNKLDSAVVENAIRLNSGKVIADANSGIKPGRFTNSPAEVLLKQPQSDVKIVYPPPMPPDMVQAGKRMRAYADEVLGFPDARQGNPNAGNVGHELVETEIGASQGTSRLRARLLHMAVQKAVQMLLLRKAQFERTPRYIPYFEGSQFTPVLWDPNQLKDAKPEDYLAHIDPASFEVRTKTAMQRLATFLARTNKIADEDLFRLLELPDWQGMAARNKQQLQLMAMAQQRKKKR
jgi:hypothetical protein